MNLRPSKRNRKRSRLLETMEEDPLSGVANLFDAAMVFAVALLLSFFAHAGVSFSKAQAKDQELPKKKLKTLKHFRALTRTSKGKGRRLGVAYRLDSGEVVYVPEQEEKSKK